MSEPLTLAFDTSAAHCAAALLSGDRVLDSRLEPMEKGQAERLMELLSEILAAAGVGFRDVTVIGVGTGPGNFTGIRLSVAAARGLALSTGAVAVGVSRLEAAASGLPLPAVACFDARRGALWLQAFTRAGPGVARMAERSGLAATGLPAGAWCVGDAAEHAARACGGTVCAPALPIADAIGRIAWTRRACDPPSPRPHYLRAADAVPAAPAPPLIP